MNRIKCFALILLIFSIPSCSKMDKSIATQWWGANSETAMQIVSVLEQDVKIDVVDTSDEDKFKGEVYRRLVGLLIQANLKKISVLRGKINRSEIDNVRFIIDSYGLSTDGCGLTVEYINSDNYLSNLKNHVAYIEQINGNPHWYIAIYGDNGSCIKN
ncbi:hypothetical protein [Pseudidiomarina taiwanensis]|uniref:Lipoprotein n=1 Tax=Pseudidiomarina taiwanensis TaxID=337250 RepID=A0A432ZP46_9GAMM|nr:hypothetical protein [Pseudidiomarina taiwanensis]RUO79657.1 hypothetical protein CWI83_03975 [Pseudidiomarina taiwanensis]